MKYIISTFLSILIFVSGVIIGGKHYSKTEIQIKEVIKYETKWKYKELKPESKPVFDQDNFNRLLQCYDSELDFGYRIDDNKLTVMSWDSCKTGKATFEIKSKIPIKTYLTIGIVGVGSGIIIYHLLK